MKYSRNFFRCEHCGNFVGMVDNAGVKIICCGEPMKEVIPNTTEAATEKHIPAVTRDGDKLSIQVGSTAHPMTEEHHIAWIMAAQKDLTTRVALEVTGQPNASLCIEDGDATVYAYCNLHGLWAIDI